VKGRKELGFLRKGAKNNEGDRFVLVCVRAGTT